MVVSFDKLNRLEQQVFVLCNPGCLYENGVLTNTVGLIPNTEAEENVFNFNATSELNFRVNAPTDDADYTIRQTEKLHEIFDGIQKRRLIFQEGIGFFMISGVSEHTENGKHFKDVSARSIESELEQKQIPYIGSDDPDATSNSVTYEFTDLFEMILNVNPLWSYSTISPSVAAKSRTFSDVDIKKNCLGFLLEDMQDAYECIFIFDIINRTISVEDQNNYSRKSSIMLSHDDLIQSSDVNSGDDDIYTALRVSGAEDVSIQSVNPLGGSVIYNFDHYIDWMSNPLQVKIAEWKQDIASNMQTYRSTYLDYNDLATQRDNLNAQIDVYEMLQDCYEKCYENAFLPQQINGTVSPNTLDLAKSILTGYNTDVFEKYRAEYEACEVIDLSSDDIADIRDNIVDARNAVAGKITDLRNEVDALESDIRDSAAIIDGIVETLKPTEYFGQLYSELCCYIFEGDYSDEYITITDEMTVEDKQEQFISIYDRATTTLNKCSRPQNEYVVNVENFVFIKDFEHLTSQLETGTIITAEIKPNVYADLFLITIELNYDDKSFSLKFGPEFNRLDPKAAFEKTLGNIDKSSNSIGYLKNTVYPIKNEELPRINASVEEAKMLSLEHALTGSDQDVEIDASGYTGKRKDSYGDHDDKQVKIVNNAILFTEDGWRTCSAAIGEVTYIDPTTGETVTKYGIVGDAIISDIVLANEVTVRSDSDYVVIDKNGISAIYDGPDTLEEYKDSDDFAKQKDAYDDKHPSEPFDDLTPARQDLLTYGWYMAYVYQDMMLHGITVSQSDKLLNTHLSSGSVYVEEREQRTVDGETVTGVKAFSRMEPGQIVMTDSIDNTRTYSLEIANGSLTITEV